MNFSNEALISATKAAVCLGVSSNTVRRHFPIVRVGGRVLVRLADVEAKIAEGRAHG